MRFLLDTDICIHLIRHRPEGLLRKLTSLSVGEVGVSTITVAELEYGVWRSSRPEQNAEALTLFLLPLALVDFDYQAAKALGIHISTVSQWKRRDEQFLERYIRARAQAELRREVSGGAG
jgi:tRNA(fMet)-specific endonuclease VapC